MMPVNAHTSKKFTRLCFEKSEVTSAEYQKKQKISMGCKQARHSLKMVVSKHLTHFCFPIRLVLHQRLNSHVAYPGIPP